MNKRILLAVAATLVPSSPAPAYDWQVQGRVTSVEVTYAPSVLPFRIDAPAGACPADNTLTWTPLGSDDATKAQNYAAVLATLLTAKASGRSVKLFGLDAGCAVTFVYIV